MQGDLKGERYLLIESQKADLSGEHFPFTGKMITAFIISTPILLGRS